MTAPELLALYSCHLPTSPGQAPKILKIQVKVLDTREIFSGRVDVLVTPVAGEGEAWVSERSLKFEVPPEDAPDEPDIVKRIRELADSIPGKKLTDEQMKAWGEGRPMPKHAPDFRDQVVDALKTTDGIPKDGGARMLDRLLGGTPICPECGAPIRWDTSPDAVPAWVHVVSSECSGTRGLAEPRDAPK